MFPDCNKLFFLLDICEMFYISQADLTYIYFFLFMTHFLIDVTHTAVQYVDVLRMCLCQFIMVYIQCKTTTFSGEILLHY